VDAPTIWKAASIFVCLRGNHRRSSSGREWVPQRGILFVSERGCEPTPPGEGEEGLYYYSSMGNLINLILAGNQALVPGGRVGFKLGESFRALYCTRRRKKRSGASREDGREKEAP